MKYLHKHPKELEYSLDEVADIIYICREIDKNNAENASAILEALLGSRF